MVQNSCLTFSACSRAAKNSSVCNICVCVCVCGRVSCALKTVIGATCSVFHMNYNAQNGECEMIRFNYVFLQNQIILQYYNKHMRNLAKHAFVYLSYT